MSSSPVGKTSVLGTGLASASWFERGEDIAVSHQKNFGARDRAHEHWLIRERRGCRRLPTEKIHRSGRGSRVPVGSGEVRTPSSPIGKTSMLRPRLTSADWFKRGKDIAVSYRKKIRLSRLGSQASVGMGEARTSPSPIRKTLAFKTGLASTVGSREARTSLSPIKKSSTLETGSQAPVNLCLRTWP